MPTTATRTSRSSTNGQRGKTKAVDALLKTPTDLAASDVTAVTNAMNPIIADAIALYLKTLNFHWHLAGRHFRDYHRLFDEQAAEIIAPLDELAERVRKIGGTTLRSVSHVTKLQTIADDNDEFVPAQEMIARLLADNRKMAEAQRAAIEVCEEHRDTVTGNLLQEILDATEKRIWFLFEISRESDGDDA